MRNLKLLAFSIAVALLASSIAQGQCGVERWPVKIGTDSDAGFVRRAVITPTTIESLTSLTAPRPLPQTNRVFPTETTVYSVTATLTAFVEEDDSDYHLVLSDDAGRTMIAEIPAVHCFQGSVFSKEMVDARATFDAHLLAGSAFQQVSIPVEITGVGFFDFIHGQNGVAPNGIELHPVLSVNFSPTVVSPPPMHTGRRRAAWPGVGIPKAAPPMTCTTAPTFTISLAPSPACAGQPVTLRWQASDPASVVSIVGVGSPLPSSGSAIVGSTFSEVFSGTAANSCGTSTEAMAVLDIQTGPSVSIFASPTTILVNTNASITVSVFGSSNWSVSSSLFNSLSLTSGFDGTLTINYVGTHIGVDVIDFVANSSCGQTHRSLNITVNPPSGGGGGGGGAGLVCCDGSISPSCTNCADKSGCCSSHGGVCGCG